MDLARPEANRDGNRPGTSFEEFFRSHYADVVRIARSVVGDAAEAEDVAQEVFLSVHGRFPFEGAAGWVRVAAAHTALNALRGARRRERRERGSAPPAASPGSDEALVTSIAAVELRRGLARLPQRQATVLVLRHSGYSYAEIAEATGLRPGSVGTVLRRAEVALRKEFDATAHL